MGVEPSVGVSVARAGPPRPAAQSRPLGAFSTTPSAPVGDPAPAHPPYRATMKP